MCATHNNVWKIDKQNKKMFYSLFVVVVVVSVKKLTIKKPKEKEGKTHPSFVFG